MKEEFLSWWGVPESSGTCLHGTFVAFDDAINIPSAWHVKGKSIRGKNWSWVLKSHTEVPGRLMWNETDMTNDVKCNTILYWPVLYVQLPSVRMWIITFGPREVVKSQQVFMWPISLGSGRGALCFPSWVSRGLVHTYLLPEEEFMGVCSFALCRLSWEEMDRIIS